MPKNKGYKPFLLVILDGWGISKVRKGNAIALANTPVMDNLLENYPHSQLIAGGKEVGLPPYQNGNSEAGHMNIGAGRVAVQDSVVISHSINDGSFFSNKVILEAVDYVQKRNSTVHLMGLITDRQSAHADPDHIIALLTLLRIKKIKNVILHLFTDGRDSYQYSAVRLVRRLQKTFINGEKIGTIIGRFYAMDRNKEWKRTELAYNALVEGEGIKVSSAEEAILQAYNRHENDEYIKPSIINDNGKMIKRISDDDAVIFFNLRSDRVRQLTKAFVQLDFEGFNRSKVLEDIYFVGLTDFGLGLPGVKSAFPARKLENTLPFILSNLRQLYIAETEKYAHITYFFNGGHDHPVDGEKQVIIKSPHAYSYKEKPEMSAEKITDYIEKQISMENFDFIAANYANADMVAHTGDIKAGIRAVEIIDMNLGRLKSAILSKGGTMIITADHGNIEELIDIRTGQVDTYHTGNPVPFIIVNDYIPKDIKVKNGILADIAPTILYMLNIKKPKEMGDKILCKYQISQPS